MSKIKIFGSIEKVDAQEDGTLIVSGVASTESVDSQGEIVRSAAMEAAIPDYMKFGAVREMHQPLAAGTALKCFVKDGVTHLEAHIVDPVAVKKVETGVYKGFSIGGKVKKRDDVNKNTITELKLTEISLVDVPANPDAVLSLGKALYEDEIMLGDLRKNLYDVGSLAEVIQRLGWLTVYAAEESEYEGDSSPIPAKLAAAVKALGECLTEMAAEEVAELIAALPAAPMDMSEMVQMAAKGDGLAKKGDGLAKKGARFSKATKEALGNVHGAAKAMVDHLDKLGYDIDDKDDKDQEEASTADAGKAAISELQKAHDDTLSKVTTLEAELAKANTELAELKKQPGPTKGSLTVVTKSGDATAPVNEAEKVDPVLKGDGTVDEAATLIKAAHRSGPTNRN